MLLKKLAEAFGVSGYEKEIREVIKEELNGVNAEITTDSLGNLIVFLEGSGANRKRIMLAAHMDEIGLQVTKIEEDGKIKVKNIGHLWIPTTYMSRIKFRNGIDGVVSSTIELENVKKDFTKLYVDIGAASKEEVLKHIRVGDVASYVGEYTELLSNNVMAKALDNRIGCYIMLEAIKKISNPYNDLYFVFTVQEEVGCRGSKVCSERIKPDMGIAVDITPAHDYPCDLEGSNTLGNGTAIKISDTSVICDEYIIEEMVNCCKENGIKYQFDVIYVGGTDASSMNQSNFGVKVGGISVATRFPHGPNSMLNMEDVNASIELIKNYVNREFKLNE